METADVDDAGEGDCLDSSPSNTAFWKHSISFFKSQLLSSTALLIGASDLVDGSILGCGGGGALPFSFLTI